MNFDPLAMDGNKDDALKCLNIARKALNIGDRNRAVKFIAKARRLDPKLPLDDLLSSLEQESNCSSASSSSVSESASSNNPSLRQRVSSNGLSSEKGYSEEQVKLVRKVRNLKDYYEILGVERSCSVEDVRKAYRKLSLKVHPDKNKAPGAEEAFKAVSKAFQCLSNEESKKKYDVCGSDEVVYERAAARRGARAQGFNGFYDMDVDADEIFRNFFYGGMPSATTQFRGFTFRTGGAPMGGDHGSGNLNLRALVQLLPFFIIILSNFIPSSQPIYALSKSYPYEYRFSTARGVNYYVRTARFEQEYPYNSAARVQLEAKVERDYFSILTQNCRAELQRRQWGLAHETPHCDRLDQLQARA